MAGKKILCVDDSPTVLMMERIILHKHAYELITASNGEEAVQRATSEQPDLILMDVIMPKMNGIEACLRIRNAEVSRAVPIIMVTTRGEEENVRQAFANGCNDYVTKPINGVELLTKLRNLLSE